MDDGELKDRIMRAASGYFVRHGFGKTTQDEIAGGLGMSKKTLYKFFPSKEELFRQTALMHLSEVRERFEAIGSNPEYDFIARLIETMRTVAKKLQEVGNVFKETSPALSRVMRELTQARQTMVIGFFRKLFNEGKRQGYVERSINENIFIAVLITILQSLFNPETLAALPFGSFDIFKTLATLFLTGCLSDEARKKLSLARTSVKNKDEVVWYG